jgi:hypothetical protein
MRRHPLSFYIPGHNFPIPTPIRRTIAPLDSPYGTTLYLPSNGRAAPDLDMLSPSPLTPCRLPYGLENRLHLHHYYSDLPNDCTIGFPVRDYPIPAIERARCINLGDVVLFSPCPLIPSPFWLSKLDYNFLISAPILQTITPLESSYETLPRLLLNGCAAPNLAMLSPSYFTLIASPLGLENQLQLSSLYSNYANDYTVEIVVQIYLLSAI